MALPELTVIVPVYNGMPYLPQTIDSILIQDRPRFEVLIVDDGSNDDSPDYLHSIGDSRVRILTQENRGLCATMNRGITEAKSPYIARIDQDDISHPQRLVTQFGYLSDHPDVDCVFSLYEKFGRQHTWNNLDKVEPTLLSGSSHRFDPEIHGSLLHSTLMCKYSVMMALGGYRSEFYPADDWDLLLRMHEQYNVQILSSQLVLYRFHREANTYRYYWQMQERRRWAEDCAMRRRAGLPERSLVEFNSETSRHFLKRIRQTRKDRADYLFRRAGQEYLDGDYVGMIFSALPATILAPHRILKRAIRGAGNLIRSRGFVDDPLSDN